MRPDLLRWKRCGLYQWRIALTYSLTLIEDLLELSYPWATGIAINGVLDGHMESAAPLIVAWASRSTIGLLRRMYDTRLYTQVYNHIVEMTILRQRRAGVPSSRVAARSAMSREFVTFFEKDVATLVTTMVGIFGSLGDAAVVRRHHRRHDGVPVRARHHRQQFLRPEVFQLQPRTATISSKMK